MDTVLAVLLFGGLVVLALAALFQSLTRPAERAKPRTRYGRPSYGRTKPKYRAGSAPGPQAPQVPTGESPNRSGGHGEDDAIRAFLLNSFNEALARLAERPGGLETLQEKEVDQRVTEAMLNDLSDHMGVSRREAAAMVAHLFKDGEGQPDSPLTRVRRIAAGTDN